MHVDVSGFARAFNDASAAAAAAAAISSCVTPLEAMADPLTWSTSPPAGLVHHDPPPPFRMNLLLAVPVFPDDRVASTAY